MRVRNLPFGSLKYNRLRQVLIALTILQNTSKKVIFMSASLKFSLSLIAFAVILSIVLLAPGRLLITTHLGDVFHALDASYRIADGELPHLDFMTPIGLFAFAPFALFLSMGFGPGSALLMGNVLVTALLLPATIWASITRLDGLMRWVFGATIVIFNMAVIYGGVESQTSFAMHYNRWAWSIAFMVLLITLLPNRNGRGDTNFDAVFIGLGLSLLTMLKITYFMAFGGAIFLILLSQKRFRLMIGIAIVGVLSFVALTLALGVDYWFAYADNLIEVANTSLRPYPYRPWVNALGSPDRVVGMFVLTALIIIFRKKGLENEGLVLLILTPAFAYVMYQNWGNDEKWLFILGIYLISVLPKFSGQKLFGQDAQKVMSGAVIVVFTLFVPIMLAMGPSIFRASLFKDKGHRPVPFLNHVDNLWSGGSSGATLGISSAVSGLPDVITADIDADDEEDEIIHQILGEPLPECKMGGNILGARAVVQEHLKDFPETSGQQVLEADILNTLWMFTDIKRTTGGAPWYYGGDAGLEEAAYYLVSFCPMSPKWRSASISAMEDTDWGLDEVGRTSAFILFKIRR